jgi:hypothetical protein
VVAFLTFLGGPIGRWLIVALLVVGSYGAAYWKGRQAGWDARDTRAQAESREADKLASVLAGKRRQVTERVVVQYRDRVRVVTQHGEEVIHAIERSIPADAPDLAGGFRVLHDASATGQFPAAAGGVDGAAPVPQAVAIRTVAGNYNTCLENSEKLIALQNWVNSMYELSNAPSGGPE